MLFRNLQFKRLIFSKFLFSKIIQTKSKSLFFYHQFVYRYNTIAEENMTETSERMVWVDLEMTGLDLEKDRIIEIACIITDKNLNVIAKAPNLIINQPDSLLDTMDDWCKEHHGKSGLTDAVKESTLTETEAEKKMLKFIKKHTPKSICPLAGNTVHVDKTFLDKYMPSFTDHLHYRIIDVTSIKELCRRWYPTAYRGAPRKALTHRALDDIQESIQELKYYQKAIFKSKGQ